MNAPFRPNEVVASARLTEHRPFIDGLRAVSILAVVLYHVGVPGISGGFIGVDVFFVISGFLIISQIVEGLESGSFSFSEFWARRALRILPPYFLVLSLTAAAAAFVLVMPDELKEFGKEVGYGAVMGVNHFFLNQQGYFDIASDSKVLLHAWSLAVEEQFYVVAPLALVLLWWLPKWLGRSGLWRPLIAWTSVALVASSLAGCVLFTTGGRNWAFYFSGLRAWEFVAGGAIGLVLPLASLLSARANAAIAAAGLIAIIGSALLYTAATPYPSWRAAVPVLGAAAVILSGLAFPKSAAVRLLATPPMVWIGLVSYSWYLWHWPLIAFGRIRDFGERDFTRDSLLAILALALAAVTFYLIERPIRRWRQARDEPLGWQPVFAGIALAAAVGITGWNSFLGASDRLAASLPPSPSMPAVGQLNACELGVDTPAECNAVAAGRPIGLLIGDSYAHSTYSAFARYVSAQHSAVALLSSPGCAPMFRTKVFIGDPKMAAECDRLKREHLLPLAEGRIRPDYAMIYAAWTIYTRPDGYPLGEPGAQKPAVDQADAFTTGLHRTIADLKSWGVKRILVIGTTPQFKRPPANCVYLAESYDVDRAHACGLPRAKAEAERQVPRQRLAAALAGLDPSVHFVDPFDDFCDAENCLPYDGESILFVDTSHMSHLGAQRLIQRHPTEFRWLVGDPAVRTPTAVERAVSDNKLRALGSQASSR